MAHRRRYPSGRAAAFRTSTGLAFLLAGCAPGPTAVVPAPGPAVGVAQDGAASPDAARWVEETLERLTLREKVGQLVMPGAGGDYLGADSPELEALLAWVTEDGIGGISLSIGLPHSYAAKLNHLQRRAAIPLLVSSNMEAGPGERLAGVYSLPHLLPQGGGTRFPPVMALGAAASDTLAFEQGRVTALEARAVGVHMTFSPTLDVNSNPANPIINTRAFGEDTALVAALGTAFIRGARSAGLLTTAKHYPGHGDTEVDSHLDLPTIRADRERLDRVELAPFRAAVAEGVDAIMTAHIAVVGVEGAAAPPATLSPYFLTRVLREELGFRGLVITDAMEMRAITAHYDDVEALVLALAAGADILLKPLDVRRALDGIVAAVEGGRLPEARVEEAARRVLEAKARLGLHRGAEVPLEAVDRVVGSRSHGRLADEVAARSITLVRDAGGLVPLPDRAARILSVAYADLADLPAGRGFDRELAAAGRVVSSARVDARTTPEQLDTLTARAADVDLVVVSVYVSPRESVGSVAAGAGLSGFVEHLAAPGVPVLVISFGSPYLLTDFPTAAVHLLAWGGGEVSQRAAARALLGAAPITGRLPISVPPLYPVGHGSTRPMGDRGR
jgi:beta-N-acetylhexosaminidase